MTATAASEAFLQSASQIVLWRKAVIQPASQPARAVLLCLISQFTRCFIGSYYGHHGDAIRFNGILFLGQSVIKGKKKQKTKHTHRQEDKGSQNTLLLGKSLSSLLNPSFTLCQSQQTQSPHPPLHVKHGRSNFELSSLIAHIWIWSEGLLRVEASGPINNRAAELRVRQQSADEPVSTKHKAPSPYLRRTTLTFKNEMADCRAVSARLNWTLYV